MTTTVSRPSIVPGPRDPAPDQVAATPALEAIALRRELRSGERTLLILDDLDLVVPHGQLLAIRGPSGSGKSTLLALLAGLDRPTSGSVRIDGEAIEHLGEDELARLRRRKVGFVFQSFHLLPNLTARENVLLPLELQGAGDARQRASELLDQVGLGERGHHYPSQLSGGEQQRVALARAFAPRPRLLLADEPTGNLDSRTGAAVLATLIELQRSSHSTLVLVTHDEQVAAAADRRVFLADGKLHEDG
ncbi:MAG: ABC transporter ATP-binding protein [Acidobacteria bacterium]|nr:MAG: ABC transporter ATP-binding protein [Acidobacteriota bacterium]